MDSPYCLMYWSMIDWSETPSPFSFAMLSLAGLENSHSNISQLDTVWGQPHLHCRREPTRCTSSLELCARRAATVRPSRTTNLLFHWNIFSGDPDDFRARVLQLHLARHERNQSARDERHAADPHPRDQREYEGL